MPSVNPIAAPDAFGPTGVAQTTTPMAEQKLLDYLAQYQAQGLQSGRNMGNPSALSGEALRALNGYFERATNLQEMASRKASAMSETGDKALVPAQSGQPSAALQTGSPEVLQPAHEQTALEPAESVPPVDEAELERTIEVLLKVMHYSMETGMITTASGNISKSTQTLIRGQ